ncbi:low molecular weight phosphatase family protein [Brevibacterium aurantiacum]|uniref:Phosphotyrosine protein phosphatase I domain-containing protein n=1 Tax=Brevibacterium aurantiacum TaxID=273384 RepID=A0A3Q9NR21_BREAU|nr:hypothetical protein [Brevibacterium aurantiacum]AZT92947.1 hypothetical protein CXR23_07165 [Brevibacterium aurantiacum]
MYQKDDAHSSILFVCTGNICRSPYAEAVAQNSDVERVHFASAGTHVQPGQKMDRQMEKLTIARTGKFTDHAARQLTYDLISEFDIIVAMAREHRRFIISEWPNFGQKTFLIGQIQRRLSTPPPGLNLNNLCEYLWADRMAVKSDSIDDPYGKGAASARRSARLIDDHLETILGSLEHLS